MSHVRLHVRVLVIYNNECLYYTISITNYNGERAVFSVTAAPLPNSMRRLRQEKSRKAGKRREEGRIKEVLRKPWEDNRISFGK